MKETGLDAVSVFAAPLFVNPSRHDYRLKPVRSDSARSEDDDLAGARNMPGLDQDQSVADVRD